MNRGFGALSFVHKTSNRKWNSRLLSVSFVTKEPQQREDWIDEKTIELDKKMKEMEEMIACVPGIVKMCTKSMRQCDEEKTELKEKRGHGAERLLSPILLSNYHSLSTRDVFPLNSEPLILQPWTLTNSHGDLKLEIECKSASQKDTFRCFLFHCESSIARNSPTASQRWLFSNFEACDLLLLSPL